MSDIFDQDRDTIRDMSRDTVLREHERWQNAAPDDEGRAIAGSTVGIFAFVCGMAAAMQYAEVDEETLGSLTSGASDALALLNLVNAIGAASPEDFS